ncbi:ferritin-like domain-containing protein [Papillibacter cinnamivorans]|uniref:Uncharacterized protein n=1 Tax=Papillibacter cinnamivorans DSM 12816 TaxID=1122930 RepID=A0A1W2CNX5_9FIRM|nr:DUF2202 domain-containing protein [Papillibacter cinnamivorans]SMC86903.1 hypothetical protein SAMN02745168_0143 [Papillibacter cinnamivorans DSM 12816]
MKSVKKLTAVFLAALTIGAVSIPALAADGSFGSAAVTEDETYTLPEMLTYAIEDEYLALAEYETITDAYGTQNPFTNIIKAEKTHISELEPLFEEYGVVLPENTAEKYTAVPGSLLDAYKASVEAEISNISMYEAFLKQDLPDDVRAVFTALKNASENHLAAFEKNADRLESGTAAGNQGRYFRGASR